MQTYTAHDVVVMIEVHDFTCDNFNRASATDIDNLEDFWRMTAARYRDNPFVWFNVLNEPGWYGNEATGVDVKYRDVHRRIIQAIRDEGANNIIAIDGSQCGQDAVKTNNEPVVENMSGILRWGAAIQEGFSNVLFNIHLYDLWAGSGNDLYAADKFGDYITRVRAQGLCLPFVGECGSKSSTIGQRGSPTTSPSSGTASVRSPGTPSTATGLACARKAAPRNHVGPRPSTTWFNRPTSPSATDGGFGRARTRTATAPGLNGSQPPRKN